MRVIHLTHGGGNGIDKACLMTASNMLIGRPEDGDQNHCVCPLLTRFIVLTNDAMPEHLLGELYGPLAWEILGTRNEDPEILAQRVLAFADWTVRDVCGIHCKPITDRQSADAACAAATYATRAAYAAYAAQAYAAYAAEAAGYAVGYADAAARTVSYAAYDSAYDAAAEAAARTVSYAHYAAGSAADSATADAATDIWRKCPDIIRRVAAIGDTRPVEAVLTADQLAEMLQVPR